MGGIREVNFLDCCLRERMNYKKCEFYLLGECFKVVFFKCFEIFL